MLKVRIDTTIAKVAKVEIVDESKILSTVTTEQPLIAIDQALQKAGIDLASVDEFEANRGPGSFTGIRVGAAVEQTLSWALGKPVSSTEPLYS